MNTTVQKSTTETEAIFSKDKGHRYLLAKQWNKTLPVALVVMLYPTDFTDELTTDTTTLLVQNNCVRLNFGGIKLVNLFSSCQTGKGKKNLMQCTDKTNDETILTAAKSADKIIMAAGRNTTSKAILKRREEVMRLLSDFKDKMYEIGCEDGSSGYHPLFPKARKWILVKIISDDKKPDSQPG
jgi:hypothetical protein